MRYAFVAKHRPSFSVRTMCRCLRVHPSGFYCPSPLKLGHYFSTGKGLDMARKRHSDEDILKLLREIEVKLSAGSDVASACRGVGISDATYYNWRKRFGGMGRSQLSEMRSLEKENARLKKIVAELELDKLILKESLTYLKPRA